MLEYEVSGSAIQAVDFVPMSGMVSINGSAATISIQLLDDAIVEPHKSLQIKLKPTNTELSLGSDYIHTVKLIDNDADWGGIMEQGGVRQPFDLRITRQDTATSAVLLSNGMGLFTDGEWPVTLVESDMRLEAVINSVDMPTSSSLLNSSYSRRIALTAEPATDPEHVYDFDAEISGNVSEQYFFTDASAQFLNRDSGKEITGFFVLYRVNTEEEAEQ
jgi:hypothetical protein